MTFTNWAYIYLGAGEEDPAEDRAVISRGGLTTTIVAVPDRESAVDVARGLVDAGAQSLELCGGIGQLTAAKVIEAVGDRVPVGLATYSVESMHGLVRLFPEPDPEG